MFSLLFVFLIFIFFFIFFILFSFLLFQFNPFTFNFLIVFSLLFYQNSYGLRFDSSNQIYDFCSFNDNSDFNLVSFLLNSYCFPWYFYQKFYSFNYILQIKLMVFIFSTIIIVIIIMLILIILMMLIIIMMMIMMIMMLVIPW